MERFGRYVLLHRVGVGGMAEVFRAATFGEAGFTRQVAVKRILPHLMPIPGFVNMFIDEARIAAAMHHPNVLPVLDLGSQDGAYFMAMDYVAGASLKGVQAAVNARRMRMPDAFVFHVAMQVLQGLEHAHSRKDGAGQSLGVVHRDVSPQNVLVGFDGRVHLSDFGVARARDRVVKTVSGAIKGKYGYIAPEQAKGEPGDQRVDVYALGVVLYELLSRKPFRDISAPLDVVRLVGDGSYEPLSLLRRDLSEAAVDVVHRSLSPDPGARWNSATEMLQAVRSVVRAQNWHVMDVDVSTWMTEWMPLRKNAEERAAGYFEDVARAMARSKSAGPTTIRAGEGVRAIDSPQPESHPLFQATSDARDATLLDLASLPPPPPLPEPEDLGDVGGTVRANQPIAPPRSPPAISSAPKRNPIPVVASAAAALLLLIAWLLLR